jgi:hypothetical protein
VFVDDDVDAFMQGELHSVQKPNQVDILLNGEKLIALDVTWSGFGGPSGSLPLRLKAGENIIEFVSHNPAITTSTDSRPLAIAVKDLDLRVGPEGAEACVVHR